MKSHVTSLCAALRVNTVLQYRKMVHNGWRVFFFLFFMWNKRKGESMKTQENPGRKKSE